jgi:hypothetical protein
LFNILDSIRTSAEREAQERKEALKKQRKELEEKLRALGEAV